MSKDISRFLELVTQRNLLSDRVLANLHRQVAEKGERGKTVPLEALANLLVDKGHLTRHQADSLVAESRQVAQAADPELALAPIDGERPWSSGPYPKERPDPTLAETKAGTDDLSEAQLAAILKPVPASPNRAGAVPSRDAASSAQLAEADPSLLRELPAELADPAPRQNRRAKGDAQRSEWDSPLLLVGGGALVVLVLLGGLIWYLVQTGTGNAQLQSARKAYEDGAYSQAVEVYEQFLDAHSGHDEASAARVELGLARIRRTLDSGAAVEDVLTQSQQVIEGIEGEPAFGEAGRELAAILPVIAEGLAAKANQADSSATAEKLADSTESALALVTNTKYVPKSFRPVERIERVRDTLDGVRRRQERQRDLASTLSAIATVLEKQDFQEAYRLHHQLVERHSDAAALDEVQSAAKAIAVAEASAIAFSETRRPAITEDRLDRDVRSVLLSPNSDDAPPGDGQSSQNGTSAGAPSTAFVRIEGALFAVDVASGELLWRRYVGIAPHLPPLTSANGDALAIDVDHGELLRLSGRTGELLWRQTIGEVVGNAASWSDTLLIPTSDSRLIFINPTTGEERGFVQFAQPLATTPSIDSETNRIFVVGEQSSVYVLAPDGRTGEDAIFVGHAARSVTVPVAAIGETVCVAENFASDRSRLHVYSWKAAASQAPVDGDDLHNDARAWISQAQPIRLTGRVTTPMTTAGRRIALATDLGEIRVFDVATAADGPPLAPIASRDASGKSAYERYLLLHDSDLWLADTRLSRLKVLAAGGRLQTQDLAQVYAGEAFVHAIVVIDNRLVHVRRPKDRAGYLIAATDVQTGDALWERETSVPPIDTSLLPGRGGVAVAMADGTIHVVELSAPSPGASGPVSTKTYSMVDSGVASVSFSGDWAVASSVRPDGAGAASQTSGELFVLPLSEQRSVPRPLVLPDALAAPPRSFAGGVLVPLRIGQVLLIDPATGAPLAAPFQPPINPARPPDWTAAEIVEPNESFVIADRGGTLYLVAAQGEPRRLVLVAQSKAAGSPIAGELCVTSSSVFALTSDRRLLVLRRADLAQEQAIDLGDDVAWGPFAANDCALFAAADRLFCLADDGADLVDTSLSAPVVGRPLSMDDHTIVVALADGTFLGVDHVARSTGPLGGIGQPLALGPLLLGNRLYAVSPDGVLVSRSLDVPAVVAATAGFDR